jgi:uncharacterized protein YdaU (DUF1376 family)
MAKKDEFPIDVSDFLVDVSEFNNCEIGVYTVLLLTQWKNKDLPVQPERLADMVGMSVEEFKPLFETIKHKFTFTKENRMFNQRTRETWEKKHRTSYFNSMNGSTGGKAKKYKTEELKYPWDTTSFKEKWELWKKYKKDAFRFSYKTLFSEQGALDGLFKMTTDEKQASELIDLAINKQWQGIWMPAHIKPKKNGTEKKLFRPL